MKISRQNMGQAAFLLAAGSVLSRIFGFIREAVIAQQFGATAQTDAYLVASVIPQAVSALVAGSVAVAFVPVFTQCRLKDGEGEAWTIAGALINLTALGLLLCAALYILAAPFIISMVGPGLAPETKALAVHLTRILSPLMILTGLGGLFAAVLHSYRHFAFPAFAVLFNNFGLVGGALLLGGLIGIRSLAIGALIGAAAYLAALMLPLSGKKSYYRLSLKGLSHPGMKKIGLLMLPFLVSFAASQVNLVVDRVLASGLAEGSISALNFAMRVMQLPVGIFAAAAATAAYPFLAENAADGHTEALRRTFSEGLRLLWFIVFPLSAGLVVLNRPIVRLIFERGAFDSAATQMTAYALLFYALGIFAHAANALLVHVFYALQDTATPAKLGLIIVGLTVTLNIILVRYMAHGGLALGSTIAAVANCFLLVYCLRRRLQYLDGRRILRSSAKIVLASLIMSLIVSLVYSYSSSQFAINLPIHHLLQLSGLIAIGGGTYFGVCVLLKSEEPAILLQRVKAKVVSSAYSGGN